MSATSRIQRLWTQKAYGEGYEQGRFDEAMDRAMAEAEPGTCLACGMPEVWCQEPDGQS